MAALKRIIAAIIILAACTERSTVRSQQDPCRSPRFLQSLPSRLTTSAEGASCDGFITKGWYRLSRSDAAAKMPEQCVARKTCSSQAPGWLVGGHPTGTGTIGRRKVCFHWTLCCQWHVFINVKNCGSFFVYELKKTPGCNLRYCIAPPDPCRSYEVLPGGSTRLTSWNQGAFCDGKLKKAWYRLSSSDGTSMLPESCVAMNKCGSQATGWLEGGHPTTNGTTGRRRVCFHWKSCCKWPVWVHVKNCGNFFVYELDKTPYCNLRYCIAAPATDGGWGSWMSYGSCSVTCGGGTRSRRRTCDHPAPQNGGKRCVGPSVQHVRCNLHSCPDPCRSYQILPEATTRLTSSREGRACDRNLLKKWYRLSGSESAKMPERCVERQKCGTQATGWLSGGHPTRAGSTVRRKVCFHWTKNCCQWNVTIRVKNCGRFFVYELKETPGCNLRYCIADSGPCHSYKILPNPSTRLTTAKTPKLCDRNLVKHWYRLSESEEAAKMPEKCVATNNCGTHAPGWLEGGHPDTAEGAVERTVCFHWANECCKWNVSIKVKNCGRFFVYELDRTPGCTLRYCIQAPSAAAPVCGIQGQRRLRRSARIVGGTDTSSQEWPWQVGLKRARNNGIFCGGSLIDSNWVLTAAHCVHPHLNGGRRYCTAPSPRLRVILGEFDIFSSEGHEVHIDIAKVCAHRSYSRRTNDYDIALLQLKTPIATFNATMRPVCLPTRSTNFTAGTRCTATGFGRTSEGGWLSSKLQQVQLPIKPLDYCKQQYPRHTITNRMICAGLEGGQKDTCKGDSGGPFVCEDGATGRYVLWGAVSWGVGCARAGQPGLYTNIKYFLPWIEATMRNQ